MAAGTFLRAQVTTPEAGKHDFSYLQTGTDAGGALGCREVLRGIGHVRHYCVWAQEALLVQALLPSFQL